MQTPQEFKHYTVPVMNLISPNVVAQTDTHFHISYCASSRDYGSDTTALVLADNVFFILNGNHAAELLNSAKARGLAGCVTYFIEHVKQANHHSEHRMAVLLDDDPFHLNRTLQQLVDAESISRLRAATEEAL